jgi:hypothetical protein
MPAQAVTLHLPGSLYDRFKERAQRARDNESERFAAQLERDANKEVREMVVTWEEALEEREAKGKGEATRKAIVLLARRFHRDIPPDFEETLAAIRDLDQLYRILERVVDAPSIAELDLG